MNADSRNLQATRGGGFGVEFARASDRNSELVLAQARRNIRMSLGRDIGMHPQGYPRHRARTDCTLRQSPEFRLALHIEQQDSGFQGCGHLFTRFPNAGEHDFLSRAPVSTQHPLHLSAGNYIKSASLARQQAQKAYVRICLYRVANGVGDTVERMLKDGEPLKDCRCRVNVKRRAIAFGELGEWNILAVQSGHCAAAK